MPEYQTKPIKIQAFFKSDTLSDMYRAAAWATDLGARVDVAGGEADEKQWFLDIYKSEKLEISVPSQSFWIIYDGHFSYMNEETFRSNYVEVVEPPSTVMATPNEVIGRDRGIFMPNDFDLGRLAAQRVSEEPVISGDDANG